MSDTSTETPARPQTVCPSCEAPAERGQLVCLECGSRIALSYRRPPSWKIPVAISAVLLLLAGAGAVLAYQAIDDEAEREVAATPAKVSDSAATDEDEDAEGGDSAATTEQSDEKDEEPEAATTGDAKEPESTTPEQDDSDSAATAGGIVKDGALYTWPRDLEGFTVVILSNEDRPSAESFARSAAETGNERIGVIRSNDFESLPKGFFVVFAGQYRGRAKAEAAAGRIGRRFPGAFPQVVRR